MIKNTSLEKIIKEGNFDALTLDKRIEVENIIKELKLRNHHFPILDFELLPHQKEIIDAIAKRNDDGTPYYKYIIMMGGNGAGKCWGKGTPLLKYDGTIEKVENIKKGELMMGPDSKPRKVLSITKGIETLYEINPQRDKKFIVNESHILSLIQRRKNRKGERVQNGKGYAPEGEIINIPIKDYLKKSNRWKSEAKIWRPNQILFKPNTITINPYFLGIWLGDGNSRNTGITTTDKEIIKWINSFGKECGLGIKINQDGITYRLTNGRGQKNKILTQLQKEKLILNKHIPHKFLVSSYENRLELLAGLMDSDGYKDSKGYKIIQKRKQLSEDISFLVKSLGFKENHGTRIAKMKKEDGTIYKCLVYWNSIQGDCTKIPVKVERKKHISVNKRSNPLLTGFTIVKKSIGEYFGFELNGDHLFLDGEFRVQHNTIVGGYAMICKMLGNKTKEYGLPFLGTSRVNKVVTSTGTQLKENIEPYIVGTDTDDDLLKLPSDDIKKITREKDVLKKIEMEEGMGKLYTGTYDQGMTRLQGGTPTYLWLDEIPERWKDFDELTKRTRDNYGQFLITFTPTNYNKKIYDWIHHKPTKEDDELYGQGRRFFIQVDALKNTKANHSHMIGKSDEDLEIVRFGKFVPPTGLVYKSFNRTDNVIEHICPKKLGSRVRFYGSVDFGVKHPTAFLFIAVDEDGHTYVFDMIYKSNMSMLTLHKLIEEKKAEYGITLEYIMADSAGAREALELKKAGTKTKPVNKKKKEGTMSNRRGGIMKINQLLNLGKLIISDKCSPLIEEFETHHYAEKGDDGNVKKEDDDALDALRYFIFSYTEHSVKRELKKQRRRIGKNAQKHRKY